MKTYTRDEVLRQSTEYFKGDELASEAFVSKYALRNEKKELLESTPEQMHRRLAKEFARIEKKHPNPLSEEEIFNLFDRFKYVCPQGSPMFGIGNPYQKVSLSNCFVIDVVDSYGGICRSDERIVQISKRRGGVGLDISAIRPKGMPTKNSALTTDGIVVFMQRFSNSAREVAQNGRRGALLLSISIHHPEVMNFIRAKIDLKKVTGANISIRITDEFMEAVKKDKMYEQRWPVDSEKPVISNKVKAREIWDEIIRCAHKNGEPGILFWDTIIRNSPADSYASLGIKTTSTNPCLTAATSVYVADGRGNVSIGELAKEGKDVPVFCYDDNGQVVVKTMRNPRITGYSQPIYKVTLDDGNSIRCTGNHEFLTTDGEHKAVKDMVVGESLKIITRLESPLPSNIGQKHPNLYYWIYNKQCRAEHRYIMENSVGRLLTKNEVVHHKNYNGTDNTIDNLLLLSSSDHNSLHRIDKIGDNNPMRRAHHEWSEQKWQNYHDTMSASVSGAKNGKCTGHTHEEIEKHAITLTQRLGRRFAKKEWQNYARENGLPIEFSKWRKDSVGKVFNLSKWAAKECNIVHVDEDPRVVKTLQSMVSQGYDASIIDGDVFVSKLCEFCGGKFEVRHGQREVSFCSNQCAAQRNAQRYHEKNILARNISCQKLGDANKNDQLKTYTGLKLKLNRVPLRKEWETECKNNGVHFRFGTKYGFVGYSELKEKSELFNHRVVSIELDGNEDVYNGTVDDFHNFFVGGFEDKTKKMGFRRWLYVNNKNCGELPLGNGASCILLLQNLTSYVNNPFTDKAEFDEELFRKNTRLAQRLIDDMVDLEIEAIDGIIEKVKSDPEDDKIKANELDLWKHVRKTCHDTRRTGLGITGLGDCIAMQNVKYGSPESIKMVEKIYSTIRDEAYRSSIEMARERGAFPLWDAKLEKDNEFLCRLPEDIQKDMRKYGRRNIACLTTPPAGTMSIVAQTSWGFEPVIFAEYDRKRKLTESDNDKPDFVDDMGDKWKKYKVEHPGLKLYKSITGKEFKDSPYFGALAEDVSYEARVKMQAIATRYTCHAISSTVNLPNDTDIKTVDKIYMMAWEQGCKGLTVYRDGSRDGVVTKEGGAVGRECDDCDEASKKLVQLINGGHRPTGIIQSAAPKRPDIVECHIHRSKIDKGDWLFFIGLLPNGQPYEVFGGDSANFEIPFKYKTGWIVKNGVVDGVTQYNLILGSLTDKEEKMEFKGITRHFNNYEYGAFTRLASLTMRHGVPIKYIGEQITKPGVEGDLFSFQRAMARVLKKYIAEGEKARIECPQCRSDNVVYKNGCPTCTVCGHSACS